MKTTSNGRQTQNIKSGIFQQPLSGGKKTPNLAECDWWVLRGKLEENSEEILSVALLSPSCLTDTMVGKISKTLDNLINKLKKYTFSITVNILLNLVAKPAAF